VLGEQAVLQVNGRGADDVVRWHEVVVPDFDVQPRVHRERNVELEQSTDHAHTVEQSVRRKVKSPNGLCAQSTPRLSKGT